MKRMFVLWQPRYYNLLIEKKGNKTYLFESLIILKSYRHYQSHEILFKHNLQVIYSHNLVPKAIFKKFRLSLIVKRRAGDDLILAENFTWSNLIILVEDLIRWKKILKHF